MDKLIIEFNKKFDKQKQELIDGFKALGEEKRLPKALATIEGEQPTYKNYFKAGWQSRQAELDQAYADIETFAQAHQRECDIKVQIANELKEKDKRIEQLQAKVDAVEHVLGCAMIAPKEVFQYADRIGRALRGEHE